MKALVLTFDRNAELTEHMIHQYNKCWPTHPFTFLIPYQSETRKELNWGGGQREWVVSPAGISGTMDALLNVVSEREWIYWAIDDKYPERLDVPRMQSILAFVRSPESAEVDGVLACRTRQLLKAKFTDGVAKVAPTGERLLLRNTWNQIWIHQFLRPCVLQHLFDGMPTEIPKAKMMDHFKFEVPLVHRLTVLERNAAKFGESSVSGVVLLNTLESLRRAGRPQPLSLPVNRKISVSMGVLKTTLGDLVQQRLTKYRLKVSKLVLGPRRFWNLFDHPAGWEIFWVLRELEPRGRFSFFDIGANNGSASLQYARLFPNATGTLFEAHPDIAGKAIENVAQSEFAENLTVIPCALSNEAGTLPFHVSTASSPLAGFPEIDRPQNDDGIVMGSSSLLAPAQHTTSFPDILFESTIRVQTVRADQFLDERQMATPIFIHIDVQGAELKVLEGFGKKLSEVAAIWMEVSRVPLYEGSPLVADVAEWMESHGFTCLIHDVGKVYGDQLWVRSSLQGRPRQFRRIYEAVVDSRIRKHRHGH